jgi:hypothetical protein
MLGTLIDGRRQSDKGNAALTAMARSADMDNVASYPVIAVSAIVSVAVISLWRTVISIWRTVIHILEKSGAKAARTTFAHVPVAKPEKLCRCGCDHLRYADALR